MTPALPKAPSFVSKWRPTMRCFSSGPWQVKQLSERIGLTCRSKSTAGVAARRNGMAPRTETATRIRPTIIIFVERVYRISRSGAYSEHALSIDPAQTEIFAKRARYYRVIAIRQLNRNQQMQSFVSQ